MHIDEDVQDYVLRKLVVQIQKLVSIATYRNRQINSGYCDFEQIDIQIAQLQVLLIRDKEDMKDPTQTIKEETINLSQIDKKTLK